MRNWKAVLKKKRFWAAVVALLAVFGLLDTPVRDVLAVLAEAIQEEVP